MQVSAVKTANGNICDLPVFYLDIFQMETDEENDISVKRGWSYDGLWNLPIQNALILPPDQLQVSVNKTEHGNVGVYKRDFFTFSRW